MNLNPVIVLIFVHLGTAHYVDMYWRDFNGSIPADALSMVENQYIAQVTKNGVLFTGGLLPGGYDPKHQQVLTMANNRKIVVKDFRNIKILCTTEPERFYWAFVNVYSLTGKNLIPLVTGGFEGGSTLYIGKVFHENKWKIGKVFPPTSLWKGLNLWTDAGCCYKPMDFMVLSIN